MEAGSRSFSLLLQQASVFGRHPMSTDGGLSEVPHFIVHARPHATKALLACDTPSIDVHVLEANMAHPRFSGGRSAFDFELLLSAGED